MALNLREESDVTPSSVPRRPVLRVLMAAAMGGITLVGLAGCGGEDDDEEDDDD